MMGIKSTRPVSLIVTPSQTKLLFRWYTLNLQATIISANINIDALESATCFEPNRSPIYVFTKKTLIRTLCFRAKRADELTGELWLDKIYRKSSIWPCWLQIAHLFWPMNCPRQPDLSPSTFFSSHYWSRTPLGRGNCKKTLQIMHKMLHWLHIKLLSRFGVGARGVTSCSTKPPEEPEWAVVETASRARQAWLLVRQHQL